LSGRTFLRAFNLATESLQSWRGIQQK